MSYQVLYRRFRSQTFADLVGQSHVVRTLQNAISQGKIGHAFLFTGPRGTGKTSTARLLAKALQCEKGPTPEPCNECETCRAIADGSCMDVVEMDAASESGVDDVREAVVQVSDYRPSYCRYKVFIIDEVHDLSTKAFDALLKTIEEPPSHVVYVLATTELSKVPATIRARCQKFEFHRGSVADIVKRLEHVASAEGIEAEPAALSAIARMADGGFRDALNLFEQAALVAEGPVTLDHVYDQLGLVHEEVVDGILVAMHERDAPGLMTKLDEVHRSGRDPRSLVESLMYRLSDLTRAGFGVEVGADPNATLEAAMHATAKRIGAEALLRLRGALAEVHAAIRDVSLPRVWLEAELLALSALAPAKAAPVAQPQPRSPRAEQPAPPTPPKPAADATLEGAWRAAHEELVQAPAFRQRLEEAFPDLSKSGVVHLEFARRVDRDWFNDNPKRAEHVTATVRRHFAGGDVRVTFGLRADAATEAPIAEAGTVELPMEGERLQRAARDVFGGGEVPTR